MSGGLIQLVAYGSEDLYLTGNPQITFFKVVYRRYTNFSIEPIEHHFNGEPNFGKQLTAKITRYGDLVSKMYLKIKLSSVDPKGTNFAWIRRLGHAIINEISVDIGGTVIDRQYGTWLDIWYELARKGDHEIGYAHMIGDIPLLTEYNDKVKPEYVLYIPLQFWFNRFIGLAVPIIALQYHDMNITVVLEKSNKLIIRDKNFNPLCLNIKDMTLLTNYIFLDTDERKRFAQYGHEYLIEQVQFNGEELVTQEINRYKLDFNHPVKEVFWAIKNGNYTTGKRFVYYSHRDKWDLNEAALWIVQKSIALGNDPSDISGGKWCEVEANSTKNIGTFYVINRMSISVYVNNDSLVIGNCSLTKKINADIVVENTGMITADLDTSLTIQDISIPVEYMLDSRFNTSDPFITQFSNYGRFIDGSSNPVHTALIQFNGQDRFERMNGDYFNYMQPLQYHTNVPKDGINIYSFSLYPEEHQPSGSANFTRIEKSDLLINFKECSDLINYFNKENRIYIFAVNHNVFRVYSGLGGLCYVH